MTEFTPLLHLPEVAPNQDQKEATINTAIAILEAAMNDTLSVDVTAGDVTLTQDQFTKWFFFQVHSVYLAPATRTVTVPQTPRWFAVENQTDTQVTVTTGFVGALNVQIQPGKIALIVSDGADLRTVVPDAGGGLGLLQDLSDVTGAPTDHQLLRWVAADGQWEPWTLSVAYTDLVGAPFIPHRLGQLDDVEDGTGTPLQGSFLRYIDGVWQADVVTFTSGGGSGSTTLAGLTDVSIPTPEDGQQLIYDLATGKWQAGSIWDGAGGIGSSLPAHLYWRVNITANNGSAANTAIGELEFRPTIGGSDQATGGTPTASTTLGGFPVTNAFNNDGGTTFWDSSAATAWVRYQFTSPVKVRQITMTSRGDGFPTDAPRDFDIQYSDDGASWNTAWSVAGQTGWAAGETRTFTDPFHPFGGVGPTLDLMFDVEYPTGSPVDGQVLTWVAVDGQWEPRTPTGGTGGTFTGFIPHLLGQLDDVEDGTGTPVQGAFLRWIDGVWQAEPAQNPFIPQRLGQLVDVEDGTGTPVQGAFLRWIDGVWQAEPAANPFIPHLLGQLDDVEDGTGTPVQGASLKWIDGVWQAEPPQTPFIPHRLGQLDDVEDGTGTPGQGAYLRYIDGVWQSDPAANTNSGALTRVKVKTITTATYTLTGDDLYKYLIFTNVGAITVTVPDDTTGAWSTIIGPDVTPVFSLQQGPTAGQITVAPGSGVNVNTLSVFSLKSYGPNAVLQLVQTAANTWTLFGAQSA